MSAETAACGKHWPRINAQSTIQVVERKCLLLAVAQAALECARWPIEWIASGIGELGCDQALDECHQVPVAQLRRARYYERLFNSQHAAASTGWSHAHVSAPAGS